MALRFIEHEDVVFKRAPLVSVLSQLRFEPVLSLLSDAGVAGFQEALRDLYPHFKGEQAAQVEMADRGASLGFRQTPPMWRLSDSVGRWRVSLAVDFVAIETSHYEHFGEFLDRLSFVLEVLDRTVHPGDSTRIGLRKINLLSRPDMSAPTEWTRLLQPSLLSLAGTPLPGKVALSLSDLRLRDGVNELVIRHGFPPRELGEAVKALGMWANPAELTSSGPIATQENASQAEMASFEEYLLDADYSTPVPYPIRGEADLRDLLQEFSDGITSFFHSVITPELYQWLEPVPREMVNSA